MPGNEYCPTITGHNRPARQCVAPVIAFALPVMMPGNARQWSGNTHYRALPGISVAVLVITAGGSHLSFQMSKMPETSGACHLDTIAAYSIRGAWCTPSLEKQNLHSDN